MLTLDQFKRRGRALANRRFLGKEEEEDINHFLVHCKNARMLWDLFLSIVGTCWVFSDSVIQTLLSWQGALVGKKRKTYGWQPRYVYSGLCGRIGTWWFLKIGLPRIRGQKLSF